MISNPTLIGLISLLASYLLGSIPTAVLVCRALGIHDPRQQGSGNPGATNVLRVGSRYAAVLTLVGDLGKGLLAIWLASYLLADNSAFKLWMKLTVLAVLAGHIWSVFLNFQGGKGVATTLGACLALDWHLGLAQAGCWLLLIAVLRISALAALGMALLTPVFAWLLAPEWLWLSLVITAVLFASHHQNIRHLLQSSQS